MTEETLKSIHPRYLASRIGDSNVQTSEIPDVGNANEFSIAQGYPQIYATPFELSGKPLNRSEWNNVLNILSQLHFYWQMGGCPLWNSDIASGSGIYSGIQGYPKNAHVFNYVEDELVEFVSLADNNTETPSRSATTWEEFSSGGGGEITIEELSGTCQETDERLAGLIEEKGGKVIDVTSDKTSVDEILAETGHSSDVFHLGDTLVVTNSNTIKSAYCFDGVTWVACTGNVDASKVLITTAIDLAGEYTRVGNITKESTSTTVTGKFPAQTSIQSIIASIFDEAGTPSIKSMPSNIIVLKNGSGGDVAGEVEVGSKFTPYFEVTFNDGVFTCSGKDTYAGSTAQGYSVSDTKGNSSTSQSGSIYSEFTVGDGSTSGGEIVGIAEYNVKAKTTYSKSNYAKNNKGETTTVCIEAGTTGEVNSSIVKGVRHMFWGMDTGTGAVDSSVVRSLLHHEKSSGQTFATLAASEKTSPTRCIVAIPNDESINLTRVEMPSSMYADVTGKFIRQSATVDVEGANGYPAKAYKIWIYKPDVLDTTETYNITVG